MMYPKIVLPEREHENPSDEQDIAYNALCVEKITAFLRGRGGYAVTHYPGSPGDGSADDVVALNDAGRVIVLDGGVS